MGATGQGVDVGATAASGIDFAGHVAEPDVRARRDVEVVFEPRLHCGSMIVGGSKGSRASVGIRAQRGSHRALYPQWKNHDHSEPI